MLLLIKYGMPREIALALISRVRILLCMMRSVMKPKYKCNECGWEGDENDIAFITVHGPCGTFDDGRCPNCNSTDILHSDDTSLQDVQ